MNIITYLTPWWQFSIHLQVFSWPTKLLVARRRIPLSHSITINTPKSIVIHGRQFLTIHSGTSTPKRKVEVELHYVLQFPNRKAEDRVHYSFQNFNFQFESRNHFHYSLWNFHSQRKIRSWNFYFGTWITVPSRLLAINLELFIVQLGRITITVKLVYNIQESALAMLHRLQVMWR